jgi:hypothetical protein
MGRLIGMSRRRVHNIVLVVPCWFSNSGKIAGRRRASLDESPKVDKFRVQGQYEGTKLVEENLG